MRATGAVARAVDSGAAGDVLRIRRRGRSYSECEGPSIAPPPSSARISEFKAATPSDVTGLLATPNSSNRYESRRKAGRATRDVSRCPTHENVDAVREERPVAPGRHSNLLAPHEERTTQTYGAQAIASTSNA